MRQFFYTKHTLENQLEALNPKIFFFLIKQKCRNQGKQDKNQNK